MRSIADWQVRLKEIYPNDGKTPDYLMTHAYTKCSNIGRHLLKGEKPASRNASIIGTISWLIGIANHFQLNYEQCLLERFPGCCPYCISAPCVCDRTQKQALISGKLSFSRSDIDDEFGIRRRTAINRQLEVLSFKWFLENIARIYPGNKVLIEKTGQGYVVAKLLEEGGELHRAYSLHLLGKGEKEQIGEELADLTAWLISCWDWRADNPDINSAFEEFFSDGCPQCKKRPCECKQYSITVDHSDTLRKVRVLLDELSRLGVSLPDVTEASNLARQAETQPDTKPEQRKTTIKSLISKLGRVSKVASETTGAAKEIAQNLSEAAKNMNDMLT